MGRLVRRGAGERLKPKNYRRVWLAALQLGIMALFGAAGLYGAITDPWGTPISPLIDVYELLTSIAGK